MSFSQLDNKSATLVARIFSKKKKLFKIFGKAADEINIMFLIIYPSEVVCRV